VVMYNVVLSKAAVKHTKLLSGAKLAEKAKSLLAVLKNDPFQNPPPYEQLVGEFKGLYSRRINYQHRLVYSVDKETNTVYVMSMWTHYETI